MKSSTIIALCLGALGLMAIAHAMPPDGGPMFDASMQMARQQRVLPDAGAAVVAPLQVVTAAPPAPVELPIQELVALALTLAAFCLRRFSPNVAWLHTGTGLALVSTLTMVLTTVAGVVVHQGVSVRVVLVALTSAMTAALAQANTSPMGTGAVAEAPPASITDRQIIEKPVSK